LHVWTRLSKVWRHHTESRRGDQEEHECKKNYVWIGIRREGRVCATPFKKEPNCWKARQITDAGERIFVLVYPKKKKQKTLTFTSSLASVRKKKIVVPSLFISSITPENVCESIAEVTTFTCTLKKWIQISKYFKLLQSIGFYFFTCIHYLEHNASNYTKIFEYYAFGNSNTTCSTTVTTSEKTVKQTNQRNKFTIICRLFSWEYVWKFHSEKRGYAVWVFFVCFYCCITQSDVRFYWRRNTNTVSRWYSSIGWSISQRVCTAKSFIQGVSIGSMYL
jgi:hypothetical protein